jgi:hypothetical protein
VGRCGLDSSGTGPVTGFCEHGNEPSGYTKVNLSLCLTKHHTTKAYWGSGSTATCILDLGSRRR